MTRYQFIFIVFLIASLLVGLGLLLMAFDYSMANFDCDIPYKFGEGCSRPKQNQIAVKAAAIIALWCAGLWLLLRERKKR